MQVARGQIDRAGDIKKMLMSPVVPGLATTSAKSLMEGPKVVEPTMSSVQPTSTPPQYSLNQPVLSFAPAKTSSEEDNKRAAAAAVAAKLAASTSSAQMLTSVLSSLVAEEAASRNNLSSGGMSSGLSIFPPEKRPKLEKPMTANDANSSDIGNAAYFSPLQQQPVNSMSVAPSTSMQTPFASAQPPPPPPPQSLANPPASQYLQSGGMMGAGIMPYGYGASTLPPPPPLPPHVAMGLGRPASQSPQHPQQSQQQQQQQQQPPATGGYYRPPGIGFYGQSQPSTPPLPRQ